MSYESVQEMFSRKAAEFGSHVAIDRAGSRITYADLETRSNRLANFLLAAGVSKGTTVGLLTEDPGQIVTGILAVLKAGAVFVPLDPTFPDNRLQLMSTQVKTLWYLADSKYLEKLVRMRGTERTQARVVCLDDPCANRANSSLDLAAAGLELMESYGSYSRAEHPDVAADADAPCSVYFTSGSTGRPKAILGRLKGIDHFIRWEISAVGAVSGTRVSQLTSPSFDGFLKDVFVPLCSGGVVCAPESREIMLDAERLIDWADIEQIEVMHCVPSVFRAILNKDLNSNYFAAMRYMLLAGEMLYPADVKRWMTTFGDRIKLLNVYGSTETTLNKFAYELKPGDAERPIIPVGKAIKGSAVMIMDSTSRPAHDGAVGEVYVRTPYRSLGYYGEPELTKEVFVQNPFSNDPTDLIHRTGDFGRISEDGNLEILGRRDQQIKVRGVRIELGEIENLLREHPSVADVAVIDRDDAAGNKFLVTYVMLSNGTTTDDLRHYLEERLPAMMLPSAFVELAQLPRTLNGKLDRKSLPALDLVQAEREIEPGTLTPIEEVVAAIWCEVLRLPAVGRSSNFFNIGGHSLLATQVTLRVRDLLKVELPISSIFESSTLGAFSELIQAQINEGQLNAVVPIEPISREQPMPLSFAQQRLWFQEELARGTSTFHIVLGVKLTGSMSHAALEQTFSEIVRRHENLRTSFPVIEGDLIQVISPPSRFVVPTVDLQNLSPAEQQRVSERIAEAEVARPFDLESGPLLRLMLLRHSALEHTIICVLHHIISDGWSKGVLIREMSALYEVFCQGAPSPLAELAVQYADFAAWQRERLQGDALEQASKYWKAKLADAPALLHLPTDRPRPLIQTYRGVAETFMLSEELSQQLKVMSQQRAVSLFMTLLAAFQVLLFRYTGQDDIVVGTTIANRERSDIEGLIGFFVNILALRTDCSENPPFEDLLKQVRDTTLKAYSYQAMPFEKLVQELRLKRSPSYTPIFQVVFSFQNQPTIKELDLTGLTLSFPQADITTSQCDLLLDLQEAPGGLRGALQYNPDLFDRETIVRMLEHFRSLLQGIAEHPELRLSELPLLSETEKTRLVVDWNQTGTEYPRDVCLPELFEARAAAAPDAVALVCKNEYVSYGELNRRANQVARYLQSAGVKTGDLVAICLDHSVAEVVGLLGVLKAGAGYVPLDPHHPAQRLSFMLSDSGALTVLTQERYAERLRAHEIQTICLDTDWESISGESDSDVTSGATAENVAYVIYTSGSTGQPKGVSIPHRALVNYLCWARDVYLRNESLSFALYSSLAFDLTVTSIYVPLVTGNQVVIYSETEKASAFEQILADDQAAIWKLTPSHLSLIKDRDNSAASVKRLIVGGEALGAQLAREVYESFDQQIEIFNEYGPTEATVGCMVYQFDPLRDWGSTVSIGGPAANVQLYVLDRGMQPTPANVTGELFISGPGLAQGYLNQPQLTAERFVPNPFARGERMYQTGDLCRRLPSGNLEYVGRQDEQVKFHGYRVELNEIQWALKKHPQINNGVVIVDKDQHGHDVMIAYYASEQELEVSSLRDFLSEVLIAETIPNVFVRVAELPVTRNGKIDFQALPSLAEAREQIQRSYVPPGTSQEKLVAEIWAEVLSLGEIGIHENFFDLGGHSLLAIQVVHRINLAFQIDLRMRAIFDDPTIAGLSLLIEETLIEKLEALAQSA